MLPEINDRGLPQFVRFEDLKRHGIISSWPGLRNLQQRQGFPTGRLLSTSTRLDGGRD
jgi:hypothetical protein